MVNSVLFITRFGLSPLDTLKKEQWQIKGSTNILLPINVSNYFCANKNILNPL